jgi:hypothetical protein
MGNNRMDLTKDLPTQDIIDVDFCRTLVILTQMQHSDRRQRISIQMFRNGTCNAFLNLHYEN